MPLPPLHWSADVLPSHRWISYLPAIFLVCSPHPPSVKSLSTLSLCPCTSSRSRPPPFSGGSADLPASCSCTSYAVASGFWEQISLTDPPPPSPPPLSLFSHYQVDRLTSQLKEKADWCSELLLSSEQLRREVGERDEEIDKLESRIRELEQALLASAESLEKVRREREKKGSKQRQQQRKKQSEQ